jgi:hypothetical protein
MYASTLLEIGHTPLVHGLGVVKGVVGNANRRISAGRITGRISGWISERMRT